MDLFPVRTVSVSISHVVDDAFLSCVTDDIYKFSGVGYTHKLNEDGFTLVPKLNLFSLWRRALPLDVTGTITQNETDCEIELSYRPCKATRVFFIFWLGFALIFSIVAAIKAGLEFLLFALLFGTIFCVFNYIGTALSARGIVEAIKAVDKQPCGTKIKDRINIIL